MFINCGFADEDERVRAEVLNAALEIIDVHGMPHGGGRRLVQGT
jgi:hypothetical protein